MEQRTCNVIISAEKADRGGHDMKCPKCGSEYKTGGTDVNGNAVCKACQLKELKDLGFLNDKNITQTNSSYKIIIETELTTAEKLLWLAENESIDIWHTATEGIIYVWRNGNAVKFKDKTLDKAIKQVYDWAKQEERK